ncbi:hypothetical protein [Pedobacter endophyticus]|uniref:Lipocalin-like domain-containing protein n=1 Tax=Pedobacter endophyticus TaxID=2789740 RepID=A0A7S9PYX7_9SPHI|nr:hypothetical protein [Pedobacter endophyticus]QPH39126.1 hypothetical protein IZT61_19025 [Pedobacter endophyticus]
MKKFTLGLKMSLAAISCVFFCAFSEPDTLIESVTVLQKYLTDHYDTSQESATIKRYELNITNNGFCRYKRYFNSGKTEYFAFKLSKFSGMEYIGDTASGRLLLRTKGDDVIVQTYKDQGGDVDSMATQVVIPLKNIEAEDLNVLQNNFVKISKLVQ